MNLSCAKSSSLKFTFDGKSKGYGLLSNCSELFKITNGQNSNPLEKYDSLYGES